MRLGLQRFGLLLATLLFGAGLTISSASAADKATTITGQVSDAMCGAKHMMEGSAADCTRACIAKGSSYALVAGAKVYTLISQDKAVLDELNKLAGEQAKVTGKVDGDTIDVSSVAPAK